MVPRTVSVSCHGFMRFYVSDWAGLPTGWTSPDPKAVDLNAFRQTWPDAMKTDLPSVLRF